MSFSDHPRRLQKLHISHALTAFVFQNFRPYLPGPGSNVAAQISFQGDAIMAMIYNAQKVPFGAISTYRVTSALFGVADDVLAWNARRTMAAEFRSLSPSDLEDIGLTAAAKDSGRAGVVASVAAWVRGKLDAAKTARELSTLSPALLDDVGLTKADVAYYQDRASFL